MGHPELGQVLVLLEVIFWGCNSKIATVPEQLKVSYTPGGNKDKIEQGVYIHFVGHRF
jgi:hypothetical protein